MDYSEVQSKVKRFVELRDASDDENKEKKSKFL